MSDRVTLPTEFFDRTSEVILRQPEPQYIYAQLVFMADAAAELQRLSAMGITPSAPSPTPPRPCLQFQFFQAILSATSRCPRPSWSRTSSHRARSATPSA